MSTFQEMREIISRFPSANEQALEQYWQRDSVLTKPPKSLGRIEEIGAWYASWSKKFPQALSHPRVSVYAGQHGVNRHGVSAFPAEVTQQMVQNFQDGGAAVNQIAKMMDADLKVHAMDLDHATQDFSEHPALSETECCAALAYGMMDAEEQVDILCLGEMGIGNSTAAAAICYALYGGQAEDWVGPGTGVQGESLQNKIRVVEKAIEQHHRVVDSKDGLEILCHVGGKELAGIVGAIIACRMGGIPVILDGYACTAAAAVLSTLRPDALDHALVGHLSKEPGHVKLLEKLNKRPVLDLQMGLGEASGAVMALHIVKIALACHTGMASFQEAAVSNRPC